MMTEVPFPRDMHVRSKKDYQPAANAIIDLLNLPNCPPGLPKALKAIVATLHHIKPVHIAFFSVSGEIDKQRLDVFAVWRRAVDFAADADDLTLVTATIGELLQPFESVIRSDSAIFDIEDPPTESDLRIARLRVLFNLN